MRSQGVRWRLLGPLVAAGLVLNLALSVLATAVSLGAGHVDTSAVRQLPTLRDTLSKLSDQAQGLEYPSFDQMEGEFNQFLLLANESGAEVWRAATVQKSERVLGVDLARLERHVELHGTRSGLAATLTKLQARQPGNQVVTDLKLRAEESDLWVLQFVLNQYARPAKR
ncbi:MAG: hypothetical protein HY683_09005 [Chloroflexi bacterium]|nr:hypothetical protein [Chloroflexota bacterium]